MELEVNKRVSVLTENQTAIANILLNIWNLAVTIAITFRVFSCTDVITDVNY